MAGLFDEEETTYTDPGMANTSTPEEREEAKRKAEQRKRKSESRSLLQKSKTTQATRGIFPERDEETAPTTYNDTYDEFGGYTLAGTDPYKYDPVIPTNEYHYRDPAIDEVTGELTPPEDEEGWGIKTLDFLFGSEMAVVGIAHDADSWSWNKENMMRQWSEQPLWSNLLATASIIGTILWPATAAVRGSMKTGLLASKVGRAAHEANEIKRWKELGLIDPEIKTAVSHEAMGAKTVRRYRNLEISKTKQLKRLARRDKAKAVAAGDMKWDNPVEWAKYEFERRFSNTYNDVINSDGMIVESAKSRFHRTLDAALGEGTVGKLLETMPVDEKQFVPISAYLMSKLSDDVAKKAAPEIRKLTAESKAWADFFMEASIEKQKERLITGFIDQDTFDTIGKFHMAGVDKGTEGLQGARSVLIPVRGDPKKVPTGLVETETKGLFGGKKTIIEAGDEVEYVPVSLQARPQMTGPTMLHRTSTHEELYDRMVKGRMISDPADVMSHGYLTDELLHSNFKVIRDISIDPKLATTHAEIEALGFEKAKKLGFVSLEGEGILGTNGVAALRRMIAKETGEPETALPWIRKEIFDEIFGVDGMMEQTSHVAANLADVATTIYKTAKTAGNISTHLQNTTGNLTFLAQAGFNPLDPENIALMSGLHKAFVKLADVSAASRKIETAGKGARQMYDEAGMLKKIDFGKIKYKGTTLDLNKELTDPIIKELIEDSAFSSAEGAGNLANIARSLSSDQVFTKKVIEGINKGRRFVQGGDRVKWWEKMTRTYLEEDMLPKMAYYLSLRADGMSKMAAATEVARRLPMYNTVGSTIKRGRKHWLPWATFPAEAMRITKNNIQDYPLRMIPWLRAPQIMQSMASGMGIAPGTREEVEEATKQLPWWAQQPTTVMTEGGAGAKLGGGATGALAGAFLGGKAGAGGAVAGAAAGAVTGAVLASLATDEEHEKELRGSIMNWLPHSTFMMQNTSEDWAGQGLLPFQDFQGFLEQAPAEPLAIWKPMIDAFQGKDAFGNEVGDGTFFGGVSKAIAGLIGLVAPPIIQKYGFQTRTPDVPASFDPFGITNIARLKVEGGKVLPFVDPAMDPMTGMVGSLGHDFFLNNFGVFKSYMASAEQQLSNETITEKHMGDIRNYISKNLAFHLENGNDKDVVGLLSEVQSTFAKQYAGEPRKAQEKYTEWLERRTTAIGRHPKLRNWTDDELKARIKKAGFAAGESRSAAFTSIQEAVRDELRVRGIETGGSILLSGRGSTSKKVKGVLERRSKA